MVDPVRLLVAAVCAWSLGSAARAAEPQAHSARIVFEEFRIEPMSLKLGESFTVRARVVAHGVKLGSFILRTADAVEKEQTIPGLPLYANRHYCLAEDGRYFLPDNGKLDRDPRDGSFAVAISTQGWKERVYSLVLFASVRPAPGPFVAARRDFAVTVKDGQVTIEARGGTSLQPACAIQDLRVEPSAVRPGQPVTITVTTAPEAAKGLQLTNAYYVDPAESLPGFAYDADKKKSFFAPPPALTVPGSLDRDPRPHVCTVKLDTRAWPAGTHHLVARVIGVSGKPVDERGLAVKIVGPRDRLKVDVEPSIEFGPGTHFGRFVRLRDGTLLCGERLSTDGGRTWQGDTAGFGVGAEQLRDGSVLGLAYRCLPIEGRQGWYRVDKFLSRDNGRRFEKTPAEVCVPEAKAARGHALHPGPLFMRSILQRADGSLVALMAGWFKSDTAICPYGRERPYSRSYVCESADGGQTWRYLTTIGYAPIGSEGYNEGVMRRLPGGPWLAVLRTGSASDFACQESPLMWSASRDEGRTWSQPARTGLKGVYPGLAVLGDGQLAVSYGRPGAMIAFSADGGRTWTDPTCVDPTPSSGYTDVVEVEPGVVLVGFGAVGYRDPRTGQRANMLRVARVRYAKVKK
jgi:hypothetical protein